MIFFFFNEDMKSAAMAFEKKNAFRIHTQVIKAHKDIVCVEQAAHKDEQVVTVKLEVRWSFGLNRAPQ